MVQTKVLPISYQGKHSYTIELHSDFDALYRALCNVSLEKKRLCIVSDSNVNRLYGDEVEDLLRVQGCNVSRFVFPAGEENKTLSVIEDLYEFLIQQQFDRSDALIALGGGVTGDMTGYAAATYLRGIRFVQIPTSLLSMVDSSIGGKTGVDFRGYKNMVGAFHQPALVYVNVSLLSTLDTRQFASGMGEIIKHGLIQKKEYYRTLQEQASEIKALHMEAVCDMIFESEKIKKQVVEADPTEKSIRAYLNFGHTIGHAIEKALDFKLLHGECVALGMVSAAYISYLRGYITKDDLVSIETVISLYGLPVRFHGLSTEDILDNLKHDKKKDGAVIKFILLKHIGECCITTDVSAEELSAAIEYLKEGTC